MVRRKVFVITGATSGIGEATAKLLAEDGTVILVGTNEASGDRVCSEIKSKGQDAVYVKCDVSLKEETIELAELIKNEYERVDLLFNNAGVMLPAKEIEDINPNEWEHTFAVNVNGVFFVTASLKPFIMKSKGCIINNASVAGMHSYIAGRSYAYSTSKAAVIQFSRQMAKNYAADGIRVNCICPGIIDTKMLGDRDRKKYAERIPVGRLGKPEDVAMVVRWLASEQASYITGAVIPIDGGLVL